MTLRFQPAAVFTLLAALVAFAVFGTQPASAHSIPAPETAAESVEVESEQITSPPERDDGQGWIWLGVGAFIVFAIVGALISVLGYMDATRRE